MSDSNQSQIQSLSKDERMAPYPDRPINYDNLFVVLFR